MREGEEVGRGKRERRQVREKRAEKGEDIAKDGEEGGKGDREVTLTFASRFPKRAVSFEDGILA